MSPQSKAVTGSQLEGHVLRGLMSRKGLPRGCHDSQCTAVCPAGEAASKQFSRAQPPLQRRAETAVS